MTEAILDEAYWSTRLKQAQAKGELHQSIYICGHAHWNRIEEKHRTILARLIQSNDSILDAGCGYGRLLTLLPRGWNGHYVGLDLSPDLIEIAEKQHPNRIFEVADLSNENKNFDRNHKFDWCVLISIRDMIRRNVSGEYWDTVEQNLKQHCRKLLFLEYSETAEEEIAVV